MQHLVEENLPEMRKDWSLNRWSEYWDSEKSSPSKSL